MTQSGLPVKMTEAEIRAALIRRLTLSPEGQGAAFIPELSLDGFARRADLVVANGHLAVFEIKSAKDSLTRLAGQLETYLSHFEEVTVVCAAKHLSGVRATAPRSVGIWQIDGDGSIAIVRRPARKKSIARTIWLSFLPVDEVRAILRQHELPVGGSRAELLARCADIRVETLRDFVLAYLKRRHLRVEQARAARGIARPERVELATDARLKDFLASYGRPSHRTATPRLVRHSSRSSSGG